VPTVLPLHITVNAEIRSLAPLSNGQLVIAGVFATVNGSSQAYIAALNPDGSVAPWATHPAFQVWQVAALGSDVLVAGGGTGDPDGHAYRFTNAGVIEWDIGTDGGVQAVAYDAKDGEVIFGGHFRHIAGVNAPRLAAVNPTTGAVDTGWTPKPNSAKGTWSLFVTSSKLYAGGDFTLMGSATFRHLARFSI
jgi:trimeric autotransporter adhesin